MYNPTITHTHSLTCMVKKIKHLFTLTLVITMYVQRRTLSNGTLRTVNHPSTLPTQHCYNYCTSFCECALASFRTLSSTAFLQHCKSKNHQAILLNNSLDTTFFSHVYYSRRFLNTLQFQEKQSYAPVFDRSCLHSSILSFSLSADDSPLKCLDTPLLMCLLPVKIQQHSTVSLRTTVTSHQFHWVLFRTTVTSHTSFTGFCSSPSMFIFKFSKLLKALLTLAVDTSWAYQDLRLKEGC